MLNNSTPVILKLTLLLACAFAFYWSIRTKKIFPAIVTMGLIAGVLLALLLPATRMVYGIYVYLGFVVLCIVYGLTIKEIQLWPRVIIILMSVFIIVYWLWVLNHWHGNEVLLPIAALIIGLSGIVTQAKLKNELSFLVILSADALAIIAEHLMKAS
jgi:hypothetical protein